MSNRFAVATIGAIALALGLGGCAPEPTVLPEVVVDRPGTSSLDDDQYVVALRATQLAQAMAWNTGDFTIAPLTESTTAEGIDSLYRHYFSFTFRDYEPEVWVGPAIWAPTSVDETSEGIEVTVCLPSQDRTITKSSPETRFDLDAGRISTYVLDVADDGRISIDHENGTEDACDATTAEITVFAKAPTPPDKITEGEIRKPLEDS